MFDFKIGESPCPNCGAVHDGAYAANFDDPPEVGDFTICMKCRAVSVFGEGMRRREPTEEDILDMPLVDIARAQRALRAMKEV